MKAPPAGMCVVVMVPPAEFARMMHEGSGDVEGRQCGDERVRGSWYCAKHKALRQLACE